MTMIGDLDSALGPPERLGRAVVYACALGELAQLVSAYQAEMRYES